MAELLTMDVLAALLTLTTLEIVLGIDNLVFIAILAQRLPKEKQDLAWKIGLSAAAGVRILLLFGVTWMMSLTTTFVVPIIGWETSPKDLILIAGGLFLLYKATHEVHVMLTPRDLAHGKGAKGATLGSVIFQILLLDMVFSLDSVITAVGMTEGLGEKAVTVAAATPALVETAGQAEAAGGGVSFVRLSVMIAAVVIAIGVMLIFAKPLSNFVRRHPPIKMLALAFLVLIGALLVADGFHHHIPRGYVYAAMGFAVFVELLQMKIDPSHKKRKKATEGPVTKAADAPLDEKAEVYAEVTGSKGSNPS